MTDAGTTPRGKLSDMFKKFDEEGGGSIKELELCSIVRDLDSGWTLDRLSAILGAAGALKDGTVDCEALLQFLFEVAPAASAGNAFSPLTQHFLSQAYTDGKTMPLEGTGYRISTTSAVYVSESNNYAVWQECIDFRPPESGGQPKVLFHYCPDMTFQMIVGESVFSASGYELMRQCGADGLLSGSSLEAADLAVVGGGDSDFGIRKFCIPLIVTESMALATSVSTTWTIACDNVPALIQSAGWNMERRKRNIWQARKRELGAEHPTTLGAMNDLAFFLEARGSTNAALDVARKCLVVSETALGMNDQMTLTNVANLAYLLERAGQIEEAEKLARRALEGREATLGATHNDTLTSVYNLAQLLESQGRLTEAEELYKRELAACTETFGARSWQARESSRNHIRFCKEHKRGTIEQHKKLRVNRFGTAT